MSTILSNLVPVRIGHLVSIGIVQVTSFPAGAAEQVTLRAQAGWAADPEVGCGVEKGQTAGALGGLSE